MFSNMKMSQLEKAVFLHFLFFLNLIMNSNLHFVPSFQKGLCSEMMEMWL